ncbi:hypothetical protein DSO57_1033384 [Entomophthora muscae]|uniref:Uncharacterized protein n=1 Tax=Entomophthora muscae TaxID=34485 RepID=A0ACC2U9T7_9FUNG|nr:hypothetical protein DSO57_1033384 [Entomophthora muscae]
MTPLTSLTLRPTNTCAVSSEPATPPEEAPQPTPPKIKPAKQISLETLSKWCPLLL